MYKRRKMSEERLDSVKLELEVKEREKSESGENFVSHLSNLNDDALAA